MDTTHGLTALAFGDLATYYEKKANVIMTGLNQIPFASYGLTPEEIVKFKRAFMTLVPDPREMYSSKKTTEMARDWYATSTYLDQYHYTNNVNFFMIYIGQALNTYFGNSREKTASFLKFRAAEKKHGLFGSGAFFHSYAPKKLRER